MSSPGPSPTGLADLTADHFRPLVGGGFSIDFGGGDRPCAELVEVNEGRARAGGLRTPFALLFRTPLHPPRGQGNCIVEHPALGRLELFVTEPKPEGEHSRYEVVFG